MKVTQPTVTPPLLQARDLFLLAGYLCLAPVAWLVPQPRWPAWCLRIATWMSGWLRRRRNDIFMRMQEFSATDAGNMHARWIANRIEAELHYLRDWRRGGLAVRLHIRGREHLAEAAAAGRGAILWVAPALFAPLLVKRALAEAGFPLHHLSRDYHGPSDSRLGRRLINPLSVSRENRYLAARYPMIEGQEQAALRRLAVALKQGRFVSITCASYGRRLMPIPLLGGHLPVATGATGLAMMSGAPLLPVLITRRDWRSFEVIIAAPLAVADDLDRDATRRELMRQFAAILAEHFATEPSAFADWRNLAAGPPPDAVVAPSAAGSRRDGSSDPDGEP